VDALKVWSIKILNDYLSAPRSLRLLLPSTQKCSMARKCCNRTWRAGTGSSSFCRETNRICHG